VYRLLGAGDFAARNPPRDGHLIDSTLGFLLPWGGTPATPDLDRLNPVFFRGLDGLFRDLKAHAMNMELLMLNFYRRPCTGIGLATGELPRTRVTLREGRWIINDRLTHPGSAAAGLLMNVRMVNAVFEN